jgi:hypothetical protein
MVMYSACWWLYIAEYVAEFCLWIKLCLNCEFMFLLIYTCKFYLTFKRLITNDTFYVPTTLFCVLAVLFMFLWHFLYVPTALFCVPTALFVFLWHLLCSYGTFLCSCGTFCVPTTLFVLMRHFVCSYDTFLCSCATFVFLRHFLYVPTARFCVPVALFVFLPHFLCSYDTIFVFLPHFLCSYDTFLCSCRNFYVPTTLFWVSAALFMFRGEKRTTF